MKFETRDDRFLAVRILRIGQLDIELGQGGTQLVFIEPETEDEVEYVPETQVLKIDDVNDSLMGLVLRFEDGEYWLRKRA